MAPKPMSDEVLRRLIAEIQRRNFRNGGNWRTSPKSQGSSPDESDSRAGRSGAQRADQRANDPRYANQGAGQRASIAYSHSHTFFPNYYYWADLASEAEMVERRRRNKWAPPWMAGELAKPNAAKTWCPRLEAATMQSSDVIAGEIIAWRAWHWNGKRLRSIFVDYEWPIDGPAVGQPNNGYGIHAFKTLPRTIEEYSECMRDVLLGEVSLWGDVIEFEGGYTAEYAKVLSLSKAPEEVIKLYSIKKQL